MVGEVISIQSSRSNDRVACSEFLGGGSGGRGFSERFIGGREQKGGGGRLLFSFNLVTFAK